MEKAKDVIKESVIKGTARVPGKQLVIVVSRSQETGDQADAAAAAMTPTPEQTPASSDKPTSDETSTKTNGERSPKVPKLTEETKNE